MLYSPFILCQSIWYPVLHVLHPKLVCSIFGFLFLNFPYPYYFPQEFSVVPRIYLLSVFRSKSQVAIIFCLIVPCSHNDLLIHYNREYEGFNNPSKVTIL